MSLCAALLSNVPRFPLPIWPPVCQQEDGPQGSLGRCTRSLPLPSPAHQSHCCLLTAALSATTSAPFLDKSVSTGTGSPSPLASAELPCQPPAALSLYSSRHVWSLGSPKVSPVWSRAEELANWSQLPSFLPNCLTALVSLAPKNAHHGRAV